LVSFAFFVGTSYSITLLPLGDSITFGCGDSCVGGLNCSAIAELDCPSPFNVTCQSGYRSFLYSSIVTLQKNVTFVGPFVNGPNWMGINRRNGGYPGAFIGPSSNDWDLLYYLNDWSADNPDLILLMIGTNDLWAYRTGNQLLSDLNNLISKTFAKLPSTHIFVSSLLAMPKVSIYPNAMNVYNEGIPNLCKEWTAKGFKITSVDTHNQLSGMCPDQVPNQLCCRLYDVHPSEEGYKLLANVWLKAILPFI